MEGDCRLTFFLLFKVCALWWKISHTWLWGKKKEWALSVADLEFLKGGFRFRRITVIAWIVSSWQASMSMQIGAHPREAREKIWNLGPLRSHLLDFQAPYSEHWSGGRRNCRICSTAPVGLIAFFCSWLVKLTIITLQWPCRQILPHCISNWTYLQTKLKLNSTMV